MTVRRVIPGRISPFVAVKSAVWIWWRSQSDGTKTVTGFSSSFSADSSFFCSSGGRMMDLREGREFQVNLESGTHLTAFSLNFTNINHMMTKAPTKSTLTLFTLLELNPASWPKGLSLPLTLASGCIQTWISGELGMKLTSCCLVWHAEENSSHWKQQENRQEGRGHSGTLQPMTSTYWVWWLIAVVHHYETIYDSVRGESIIYVLTTILQSSILLLTQTKHWGKTACRYMFVQVWLTFSSTFCHEGINASVEAKVKYQAHMQPLTAR